MFSKLVYHARLGVWGQARSQACVPGVAKLSQRNHLVQYLRTYFILYAIKIKWIMCVQEKKGKLLICHKDQG